MNYFRRYEIHLEKEVERLVAERDLWQRKCERMELAIMPLTSVAGRAYAQAEKPIESAAALPESVPTQPTRWAEIQARRAEEMTQWAKDAQLKKEAKDVDGVCT